MYVRRRDVLELRGMFRTGVASWEICDAAIVAVIQYECLLHMMVLVKYVCNSMHMVSAVQYITKQNSSRKGL